MERPFVLRMLPDRLRIAIWARLYRNKQSEWLPLYQAATLRYAPQMKMELLPGDVISDCIAFTGVYEPALTHRLTELARQGGTMIDIGANLGYFALSWAAAKPSNKCICVEASPRNIDILRRNVANNGLGDRIEVVPAAAGSEPGKFRFDAGPKDQTGWGGLTLKETDTTVEVDVVRIDELIRSEAPISLLKVDVEGADTWALMGCERLLKAGIVQEIWYEQNKARMKALDIPLDLPQDFLRSVGYIATPQSDTGGALVDWRAVRG